LFNKYLNLTYNNHTNENRILRFLLATASFQACKLLQKAAITKSATTHQAMLKAMQWQEVK
jgi:hypothetical protein